ncbi:MAG TPA: carboxymuconolactone decarboxylase family protein [Fontimonas sp.]
MPRISVADDVSSWMGLHPELTAGLIAFSEAVYGKATKLSLRERELARMVIAHINQCGVCIRTRRVTGPEQGVTEDLYGQSLDWRGAQGLSERERLAAEFAERFAQDHLALNADDAYWVRLHEAFDDGEIVELGTCCALWLGAGRLPRVLDVGQSCSLLL